MERHDEHLEADLIDLGAVTSETRGGIVGIDDHENGLDFAFGLSDD